MTLPAAIRIEDPADRRIADYRDLRDPRARARYERDHGVFIVEGAVSVEVLAASGHAAATRSVLVSEDRLARVAPALAALTARGAVVYVAPQAVVEATAGFALHRGVVAAVDRPAPAPVAEVLAAARVALAVEAINDLENLGLLMRIAAAFGADALLLDPTCADPFNRRAVRVSVGQALRLPHARAAAWPAPLVEAIDAGWRVVALTPSADRLVHHAAPLDLDERLMVLVGAEGPGLRPATLALPGVERLRIAMAPDVDSLNVATAAAVALAHLVGTRLA